MICNKVDGYTMILMFLYTKMVTCSEIHNIYIPKSTSDVIHMYKTKWWIKLWKIIIFYMICNKVSGYKMFFDVFNVSKHKYGYMFRNIYHIHTKINIKCYSYV